MRVAACLTLLTLLFAGCSEAPASEARDDTFDDVRVQVSDTTGAILGVVVNDAIVPVAGATVAILNSEQSATSDEQGRFVFEGVEAGAHFLSVSKELHEPVQVSVDVVAGQASPPVTKVQLNRLFQADPYLATIQNSGFFTCSQAGMPGYLYTSSPCHSQSANVDFCDLGGVCLDQERVFHVDVGPGWQSMVFEMTWEPTAQGTSERMGMSVSTFHPERNKNHWFASVSAANPMVFRIDTGEMHPTAQEGDGPMGPVPAEGMTDMSMYMSVRPPADATCVVLYCAPPGLSIDQSFETWHTQFYYAPAPDGWGVLAGSPDPFS